MLDLEFFVNRVHGYKNQERLRQPRRPAFFSQKFIQYGKKALVHTSVPYSAIETVDISYVATSRKLIGFLREA